MTDTVDVRDRANATSIFGCDGDGRGGQLGMVLANKKRRKKILREAGAA